MIVHEKEIKIYPNTKPWVNKDLADVVNARREKWREGDKEGAKQAQKDLDVKIKENKSK